MEEEDEASWLARWQEHPLVKSVHISGTNARLMTHDVEALQQVILRRLVADNKGVVSLAIKETSLDALYRQFV